MKYGICLPIRRDTSLEFNIELAKTAEELGFDSVWASDHVVIPDSVSDRFTRVFYDPVVTLAAIASVTDRIRIGTSVIILPYRNPVILAKSLSTLDLLSGGRLIFGIAPGWLEEEFEALGIDYKKRQSLTDEYVKSIIELWSKEKPAFRGKTVNFENISFYPKPAQKPYPEIWIGGSGSNALRRVAEYGNAWHPTWLDPAETGSKIGIIREHISGNGRDKSKLTFSIRNRIDLRPDSGRNGVNVFTFGKTPEEVIPQVNEFRSAGVDYIVFDPVAESDSENIEIARIISEEIMRSFS